MALGVTVDFNARLGNIAGQVDRVVDQLNRFQQRAETMSSRVNKAFSMLGVGLSVAGVVSFVKSGIDAADALNDMSLKTGIAVEKLSGFKLVTEQSGTNMDSFTAAANKLNVEMGKNSAAFAKLGIDAKDPADAFVQLATVMAGIEDPQQRAALGAKALGKGWAEMAPLLMQGGAALKAAVEQGAALNGVTTEMAKNADEFNDQLAIMTQYMGNAAATIAGPLVKGFNNLSAKMANATADAITFDSVMNGIADWNFDQTTLTGVAGELKAVNSQIDVTEKKLADLKAGTGPKWSMGDTTQPINLEAEQKKLEALYQSQESLYAKLTAPKAQAEKLKAVPQKNIDDFIAGGADKPAKTGGGSAHAQAKKAIVDLTVQYDELIARMERENALHGETKKITELQYDIQHGLYKDATESQQIRLQQLAYEADAIELLTKKQEALADSARAYGELKFSNKSLIQSDTIQSGFNAQLAANKEALDAGTINEAQFKTEMDKLSQAYNADFIDPAKSATGQLSEFAVQAARNMQTSFADFLFDPFAKGTQGLLDGFTVALRQMAAQAASQYIFEGLLGKTGVTGDTGGLLGQGLTSLSKVDWGSKFSKAGSYIASFFAEGGVMTSAGELPLRKYAAGGVATSPQLALFGEGRGPEAYVPLPDGRRIPVAMQGGGQTVNVSINLSGMQNSQDLRLSGAQVAQRAGAAVSAALARSR